MSEAAGVRAAEEGFLEAHCYDIVFHHERAEVTDLGVVEPVDVVRYKS